MGATISLLFHTRKAAKTTKGTLPIYLRVTINGSRFETSISRDIEADKWVAKTEKAKGIPEEAKTLNSYLDTLRNTAFNYQREIRQEGKELNIQTFKEKWLGIREKPVMLVDVFLEHNRKMKLLVGKEYAHLTYIRHETTLSHTKKFLQYKYGVEDVDVKKLDFSFINEFAFWLKAVRNCNQNSTINRQSKGICVVGILSNFSTLAVGKPNLRPSQQ